LLRNGKGVAEDDAEAVKWYRLAADQGDADDQYNLGVMYDNGDGVPENDAEAARWFRLAADQGDALDRDQRDAVAEFMTQAQIAEAQRLSAQWRPKPAN
jgi:TPR repeat protein